MSQQSPYEYRVEATDRAGKWYIMGSFSGRHSAVAYAEEAAARNPESSFRVSKVPGNSIVWERK